MESSFWRFKMAGPQPTTPELINRLSSANIMEVFPQDLRDKVKASRLKYFALFEQFKSSLVTIPYFDEVFSYNNGYFESYMTKRNSARIKALDPTKKELMSHIVEDIFALRDMFIDSNLPNFFKVQTTNGTKVNKDGEDINDKNNNTDLGEQVEGGEKDDNTNDEEKPEGAFANVKHKHTKKKKGGKKRSKRGGNKNKDDGDESKEKWTGKKEVQSYKKTVVKIRGRLMTLPYPPTDKEKLHIDHGENRQHMDKVCEHMEGFCEAILDIIETDLHRSRDTVFKGLADIFGKIAEPLNYNQGDYEKLKAIVELVSSATTPKEDYSNYGAGTAQCETHRRETEEKEDGVIIEDVTDLDPENIKKKREKEKESGSSAEESDAEETSCTCPCHGPCPCCCSGCYMLNHQDLVQQNNGEIVKIIKKGLGILPEKTKETGCCDQDDDGVLTGPRIEEIVDDNDEERKKLKKETKGSIQEQNTFNLRGSRNTKLWEAAADDNVKKALDDNEPRENTESMLSEADINISNVSITNITEGNHNKTFDTDVPTSSVEDELDDINDVKEKESGNEQASKSYPTEISDTIPDEQVTSFVNIHGKSSKDGDHIVENDHQPSKDQNDCEKSSENCAEKQNTENSNPHKNESPKKRPKKPKKHNISDFKDYDKCSHCCCHCGCNRQFDLEMPSIDDPEGYAITFMEELNRFSPANRNHVFEMAALIASEQKRSILKQKVVEVGMKYFLRSLKELNVSFHLYIIELVLKIIMSTTYARKYCYRDPDFFPALSRLLAVTDPCKNRDKNQLRGDAAHVLYVTLMGGPREAFEKVAATDTFGNLVAILYEDPNNHSDAQSAEDVFACFMMFTDEWDLFIVHFKAAPIHRLIKHWRRYALEYTGHLPNFIWTLETLKKRLQVLFEAYRHLRFDIRLPKTFSVEKLEKHNETACSNSKCFKVNFTEFQSKYKKCSKCHLAYYCSKECQLSHWKKHKKWCSKPDWVIEEEKQAEIDKAIKNIDFSGKVPKESESSHLEQETFG